MDLSVLATTVLAAFVIYVLATVLVYFTNPQLPFVVTFAFLTLFFCVYADDITTHFGIDSEIWAHISEWGSKLKVLPVYTLKNCLLCGVHILDWIENRVWELCLVMPMDMSNVTRWMGVDVE